MSEIQRVLEIAKRLLAEGLATNEADARLAAVKIFVAAERLARTSQPLIEPDG